jgi:trehalose/maltose hydrolase-like predicted phosphorylase
MEFVKNDNQAALLSNHTGEWADIWSRGIIDVQGDAAVLALRKVIRGSLYYLYSFLPSER